MRVELPGRLPQDEDRFVEAWLDVDQPESLVEVIEAAMEARRPRLAARLVGLLSEQVVIEPGSDLERAQRAAALFLMHREQPEDRSWSALEDAWSRVRRRRMVRIRRRQRAARSGSTARFNRLGKRRR